MKINQLDLFDGDESNTDLLRSQLWPDAVRFPLNIPGQIVGDHVLNDLRCGGEPLIVTGYTSLDQIIDFAGKFAEADTSETLRVILGSEPFEARLSRYEQSGHDFSDEVRDYWLSIGISLHHSAKLIKAIELIKMGRLSFRRAGDKQRGLHAKIYCSATAATLGSSNFTRNGLTRQIECNARFSSAGEKRRYRETVQIAENFWQIGYDYNDELLALLTDLLKVVTWQEALARACAELLEGQWARDYIDSQMTLGDTRLWPSQRQGIAQALWVLENIGSVLIADPTGSGKTRMGANLLRALGDRAWSKGRANFVGRRDLSVLICPPAVSTSWQKEATHCGMPLQIHSHGILSRLESESHADTVSMIRRAQILSVDEAHNFLNLTSNRTRQILGNLADHIVLFTATPINKGANDLISLVEILGADNMEEETLKVLEEISRRRRVSDSMIGRTEISRLRKEIQRFTLRRTKSLLNFQVDQNPDLFLDRHGKRCRYPDHISRIYDTGETIHDKAVATNIRQLTYRLKGIALLEDEILLSESLRKEGWTDEGYLAGRLLAVKSLSAYNIMSCLRSSRAALYEHLLGTQHTLGRFDLPDGMKKADTGNLIRKLRGKASGPLPRTNLTCPLPKWLVDSDAFVTACKDDEQILLEIVSLVETMSPARDVAKAKKLIELSRTHKLILAFDSHLISLEVIKREIREIDPEQLVIVATGSDVHGKKKVMRQFGRDAEGRGIALCSDTMSEGLNLQGASAIVHLDMPSVVRVAEQRVGRVDRMDSKHSVMEAWWPDDSAEFALRADEKFLERYRTVDILLGSNMALPSEFGVTASAEAMSAEQMISEANNAQADPWDGIKDAFSPVRDLVQGKDAIVTAQIYKAYQTVSAQLLARVSLVKARKSWAFFCLKGTHGGPPKWILMIDGAKKPYVSLDDVCLRLRALLSGDVQNLALDELASRCLSRFLTQLKDVELELLPRRKQRALVQMQAVLAAYRDGAIKSGDLRGAGRWEKLLRLQQPRENGEEPDLEMIADGWLTLIRPQWHALLGRKKRRRAPLMLKDLNKELMTQPLSIDLVEQAFSSRVWIQPLDRRVLACVLGVC